MAHSAQWQTEFGGLHRHRHSDRSASQPSPSRRSADVNVQRFHYPAKKCPPQVRLRLAGPPTSASTRATAASATSARHTHAALGPAIRSAAPACPPHTAARRPSRRPPHRSPIPNSSVQLAQHNDPRRPLGRVQRECHVERHSISNKKQTVYQVGAPRQCLQRSRAAIPRPGCAYRFPGVAAANPSPTAASPTSPSRATSASTCASFAGAGIGTSSIPTTQNASMA